MEEVHGDRFKGIKKKRQVSNKAISDIQDSYTR